jgi:hypothetical protein
MAQPVMELVELELLMKVMQAVILEQLLVFMEQVVVAVLLLLAVTEQQAQVEMAVAEFHHQ